MQKRIKSKYEFWLQPLGLCLYPKQKAISLYTRYTTSEFLEERGRHPEECLFVVNKTYAFLSSRCRGWWNG